MTANGTTSTPLRLDGIVRVSKTGEREYLRSPDQQKRDLHRWAKEQGHELVHVHVAIDESAGKGGHPAIEAAKERALNGAVDGVVAPYLSRFSRNTLYGLETVQELLDADRHFFSIDCPFDLRTPDGEKYLTDKLAEARYEWRIRKANFARAVQESIERGAHLAARYGYQKANGKGSGLVVVPGEAAQVRRAYELRAGGHTWPAIAAALNESGAKPRPYKRHGVVKQAVWTHKTVRQLVVDGDVYLGVAFNGQDRHPGAHEAIVTPELHAEANRVKGTKPLGPSGGYLLSGLVRCSGCGYVMAHQARDGRSYYRCRMAQHGGGRCPAPVNVPAEALEEFVAQTFVDEFLDRATARPVATNGEITAKQQAVEQAKARFDNALEAQLELGKASAAAAKVVKEKAKAAERALARAEDDLAQAEARARAGRLPAKLTAEAFAKARTEDVAEARHWISLVYRCVVVRRSASWREPVGGRIRIVPESEAPADSTSLIGWVVAS